MFTWGEKDPKKTLKRILNLYAEEELVEPKNKTAAWERRQVEPSASRGLGFNFVEVSRGSKRGRMLQPEKRVAVLQLQAFQKADLRLGHAEFGRFASAYKQAKGSGLLPMVKRIIDFWEWLAS